MQIQVRTDDHIQGGESLTQWIEQEATTRLARFRDLVTRVEAYLTDANASKPGSKHCVLEAKLVGRPPVAVNATADKLADAFTAATEKLVRALDTELGRQRDHGHETIRGASGEA